MEGLSPYVEYMIEEKVHHAILRRRLANRDNTLALMKTDLSKVNFASVANLGVKTYKRYISIGKKPPALWCPSEGMTLEQH